ncbi:D-alanyl-D-alanine carboxypeptidase family protein [Photobacterium alginatilyticum]|uniref:serine-type D-Ala-D-Ala carboxypeptidase n=1 Tax=Photobacterium alginatilyticum TaxID=1775171 RepID=A0ABW9YDX1_9GAMM|nr:D-alanyl-D-alanine carboxypeptidase family protein [Photobacterium alginatilyticum]NBI51976.1 D-alanyl-D-alanine carboxypeptidase [Photobacterium alginatilyticum]
MTLKAIIKHFLLFSVFCSTSVSISALAESMPSPPEIAAKAWVLMSYESGQVIASENEQALLAPASLTKIMTTYVVGKELDAGHIAADDKVIISENAWGQKFPGSSKMFLNVGDEVSVDDLNRGVIISSGNDATVALAEHVAGHQPAFIEMMNRTAEKLGMDNTYFANPHGLDSEDQHTTAYDMALLTRALIQDLPDIYPFFKEKSFTFQKIKQGNRNALLWDTSLNVDGVKTGYTKKAGYSLVSSAEQNDQRLIAVVMGTDSVNIRRTESKKLLTWGFRFFQDITPQFSSKELSTLKVWYGSPSAIAVEVADGGTITVPRRQRKNIEHRIFYNNELEAPVEKGTQVGKVEWYLNDELLTEQPILAAESASKAPWYKSMIDVVWRPIGQWFTEQDWEPK